MFCTRPLSTRLPRALKCSQQGCCNVKQPLNGPEKWQTSSGKTDSCQKKLWTLCFGRHKRAFEKRQLQKQNTIKIKPCRKYTYFVSCKYIYITRSLYVKWFHQSKSLFPYFAVIVNIIQTLFVFFSASFLCPILLIFFFERCCCLISRHF